MSSCPEEIFPFEYPVHFTRLNTGCEYPSTGHYKYIIIFKNNLTIAKPDELSLAGIQRRRNSVCSQVKI